MQTSPQIPRRESHWRIWCLCGVLLLVGLVYHVSLAHYVFLPLPFNHSPDPDVWPAHVPRQVHLNDFQLTSVTAIPSIDRNLSGLAYQADAGTLLAVQNRPPTLTRMRTSGQVLSTHELRDISDVEGIAYLRQGWIALVSEKDSQIVLAQLPEGNDTPLELENAPRLQLPERMFENAGPEGITYVPHLDALFVVMEHSPRDIYRVDGVCPQDGGCSFEHARITDLDHWLEHAEFAKDLASVEYDPIRRSLVFLSEASDLIFELDLQGRPLAVRAFGDQAGDPDMPQPEGLAFAPDDDMMFIVSEPNLLYTFQRR